MNLTIEDLRRHDLYILYAFILGVFVGYVLTLLGVL